LLFLVHFNVGGTFQDLNYVSFKYIWSFLNAFYLLEYIWCICRYRMHFNFSNMCEYMNYLWINYFNILIGIVHYTLIHLIWCIQSVWTYSSSLNTLNEIRTHSLNLNTFNAIEIILRIRIHSTILWIFLNSLTI
jgi:hypothetical protein